MSKIDDRCLTTSLQSSTAITLSCAADDVDDDFDDVDGVDDDDAKEHDNEVPPVEHTQQAVDIHGIINLTS